MKQEPTPSFALNMNVAARLLYEAEYHAEAKPGTALARLGGEEWLEYSRQEIGGYSGARIRDPDPYIRPR